MPKKNTLNCPIDLAISILGDKWVLGILRDLLSGKKRTSELLRSLQKISPRTLAHRLRNLEKQRLIIRKVYPEIPPKVEYSLTEHGYEIRHLMRELLLLSERWQEQAIDKLGGQSSNSEFCSHCLRTSKSQPCAAVEQSLVLRKKIIDNQRLR